MNNLDNLSNPHLFRLYRETTDPTTKQKAKAELERRGVAEFKRVVPWYTNPYIAAIVAIVLLCGVGYQLRSQDVKQKPLAVSHEVATHDHHHTDDGADMTSLRQEVAQLRSELLALKQYSERMNDRLWSLGVLNQENWGRIKKGNTDMVTMDQYWLPSTKLEFMQNSQELNSLIEHKRAAFKGKEKPE